MRCIGLGLRVFPSVHHVVTSTDVCNMAERKEKFKPCSSVSLALDELDETEDKNKRMDLKMTREWYFPNIVQELATMPALHQMIRMKFEDFTMILQELEDRFQEPGVFLLPSPGSAFF